MGALDNFKAQDPSACEDSGSRTRVHVGDSEKRNPNIVP